MDVHSEFHRAIQASGCLHPGDTVVLGVSGGADSLVMLHLFARSRAALRIVPHVLHLNHHIRGLEADADAEFVRAACERLDIPCRVESADVPLLAREQHIALEEAARQARYRALIRGAARVGARVIAVAHNADDQAETVLMHLLRGSGLAGLRGMLPVTPLSGFRFAGEPESERVAAEEMLLLRPMLNIPRAEIEAYCAAQGLSPRQDATNRDTTYFRNRLRHEVMPHLETLIPGLRERLGRTASVIAADAEIVEGVLTASWDRLVAEEGKGYISLRLGEWRALPLALQRGALRRAMARLTDVRDLGFVHVEEAAAIARDGATGAQATLPGGVLLRVDYDSLRLSAGGEEPPRPPWPLLDAGAALDVSLPGDSALRGGWHFHIERYSGESSGADWEAILADPWAAVLNLPGVDAITLRTRRPGDRFQPQGAGGVQKVNEFMINAKIPAVWRERIPLLIAGEEIAWLCGWRVDARFVARQNAGDLWLARFSQAWRGL